ncbi:uncharacterized protein TNCV_424441 [Trichonephila clavipes]|nr:uncharacterized protein TNCV_424441 [Trichonephila clavipes]
MSTAADVLNSLEPHSLHNLTIADLKNELRFRKLSTNGNKSLLISRIVEDNNEGTLNDLTILRMQPQKNDDGIFSDKIDLLKEIESLQKQVELLSNQPPQPPPPQIDPSIAAVLSTLIETQKQLLDRQTNQNVIQITSFNDTANSIQIFNGDIIDNVFKWIKEVERISTLAHWSNELRLSNAISRLSVSAKNWQLTTENNFNDWTVWKTAFASRFKRRTTMQEFLAHQSERKMKHSET